MSYSAGSSVESQTSSPSITVKPPGKVRTEGQIFSQVLFHCVLIIICPIAAFFLLKLYLFDTLLQLESLQSNIYSAFAAVVVLHLALGNFLYHAYFDSDTTVPGFDKLVKED